MSVAGDAGTRPGSVPFASAVATDFGDVHPHDGVVEMRVGIEDADEWTGGRRLYVPHGHPVFIITVAYVASDDTATVEDDLDLIGSDLVVRLPFHDAVVDLIDGDACVLGLVIRLRVTAAWGTVEQGRSDIALSLCSPIRQVVAQDREANGSPTPVVVFLLFDGERSCGGGDVSVANRE